MKREKREDDGDRDMTIEGQLLGRRSGASRSQGAGVPWWGRDKQNEV